MNAHKLLQSKVRLSGLPSTLLGLAVLSALVTGLFVLSTALLPVLVKSGGGANSSSTNEVLINAATIPNELFAEYEHAKATKTKHLVHKKAVENGITHRRAPREYGSVDAFLVVEEQALSHEQLYIETVIDAVDAMQFLHSGTSVLLYDESHLTKTHDILDLATVMATEFHAEGSLGLD